MPKHSNKKRSSPKKTSSKKKTSGKRNQYSHVKTGQTVMFKNGACAKRQSNGQFRFVKRTSCKKSKRGGGPGKVPISEEKKRENAKQQFLEKYGISEDDLREGYMTYKKLGNDGIIQMVGLLPRDLKTLTLGGNMIGDNGAIALAHGLPPNLEELYLEDNQIGDDGIIALAQNLPGNLRELYLEDNQIGDDGKTALRDALRDALINNRELGLDTVSYTHLTLPTILLV